MYDVFKIIHIISACLLFGTGLGTAVYMYLAHRSKNVTIIAIALKHVVKGDWYFTLSSGIVQFLTGLTMVLVRQIPFSSFWIWGSLLGYVIAGFCWLPVVYLQIRLRDIAMTALKEQQPLPLEYYQKFRQWFWLGWPAFISLIFVFYLMSSRPAKFFI